MTKALLRLALEVVRFLHDELVALTPEPQPVARTCPVQAIVSVPFVTTLFPPNRYTAAQVALCIAVANEVARGEFMYVEKGLATPPYPESTPWPQS